MFSAFALAYANHGEVWNNSLLSSSPKFSSVSIRLCKHGKLLLFLKLYSHCYVKHYGHPSFYSGMVKNINFWTNYIHDLTFWRCSLVSLSDVATLVLIYSREDFIRQQTEDAPVVDGYRHPYSRHYDSYLYATLLGNACYHNDWGC